MLVLGRKAGESIVIGDNIVVTIVAIDGDKVRVGIDAPRDIEVFRSEVRDQIGHQNATAAASARPGAARGLVKPRRPQPPR